MKQSVGRAIVGAIGIGFVVVGVRGILTHSHDTHPRSWITWVIAAALAHDLILAPAIAVVGVVVGRLVPRRARAAVQVGLLVSGCVLVVGLTAVLTPGGRHYADNSSLLPLAYGRNLVIVLAIVWTAIAIAIVVALRRRTRRVEAAPPSQDG
ncbi:MAG TPA: hypothetical protein VGL75_04000 [Acidothermaceae bacterium]